MPVLFISLPWGCHGEEAFQQGRDYSHSIVSKERYFHKYYGWRPLGLFLNGYEDVERKESTRRFTESEIASGVVT